MPDFSEEEVTAGARALFGDFRFRRLSDEELARIVRAVLEACGAVPRAEHERLREENAALEQRWYTWKNEVGRLRAALKAIVARLTAADGESVAQGHAAALTAREIALRALDAPVD